MVPPCDWACAVRIIDLFPGSLATDREWYLCLYYFGFNSETCWALDSVEA